MGNTKLQRSNEVHNVNNGISDADTEKFNMYVRRSLLSGVKPIEMFFEPVLDCDVGEPLAYRGYAKVNSVVAGVLAPGDYLGANVSEKVLADFTMRVLKKTALVSTAMAEKKIKFRFITVKCPVSLVYSDDLYSLLKTTLQTFAEAENGLFKPEKICLEFDSELMQTDGAKLKTVFDDIRAAGVKIAVSGYGGDGFSIEKLLAACPDVLFTDEKLTRLVTDREKSGAVAPILNVAKSLGGNIVADGVIGDDELREFRTRDCLGFIPAETYSGRIETKASLMTFDELISAGDGENNDGE